MSDDETGVTGFRDDLFVHSRRATLTPQQAMNDVEGHLNGRRKRRLRTRHMSFSALIFFRAYAHH